MKAFSLNGVYSIRFLRQKISRKAWQRSSTSAPLSSKTDRPPSSGKKQAEFGGKWAVDGPLRPLYNARSLATGHLIQLLGRVT